jgi:Tol biopolymer transport system component
VYGAFFLSPDGGRVAALATSDIGETELWLMDLQQERAERWTPDDNAREAGIEYGIWLPDSESVLLTLSRGDSCELVVVDARRGEGGERVWRGKGMVKAQYATPDSLILFTVYSPRGAYVSEVPFNTLRDLPSDAEEAFPSLTGALGNEAFPRYSPDGQWLLYNSDFRGPWDLYVQRTESGSVPIRISPEGGGDMAQWAPSGDGIYFRRGQRYFWTEQTGNPDRPFSEPRLVQDGDFLNVDGPEMEVHPDGRRLLLLEGPGQRITTELNLILNWKQHLKELMVGRR